MYTWGEIQLETCKKMFLNSDYITVDDLDNLRTNNNYKTYFNGMAQAANEGISEILKRGKPYIKTYNFVRKTNDNLLGNTLEIREHTYDDITFETEEKESYDSIYDEQILKRNKDDLYKLITIKEKDYSGYLVVVYDPSRISLVTASHYGSSLKMLAKENDAVVAINASGFNISQGYANGVVIKDGKLVSNYGYNRHGGGIIGFTYNNVLMLTNGNSNEAIKKGIKDAVEFGPFLIVNGKPSTIKGNGGLGTANRTAIAQRKDGIVLFLVIDGRMVGRPGADMVDLTEMMANYGAYNAANLDGGGSSTLVINNELINNPRGYYGDNWERPLPNAWIVK